jgi:hypothetical protein
MLSWDPVPPESVRGHFKGYKVFFFVLLYIIILYIYIYILDGTPGYVSAAPWNVSLMSGYVQDLCKSFQFR